MDLEFENIKQLSIRVGELSQTIPGLRKALEVLELSDNERELIQGIVNKYNSEWVQSKKKLKKLKDFPRTPSKKIDNTPNPTTIAYRGIKARRIEEIKRGNRNSKLDKLSAHFVQGGAPGSGKKK